MAAVREVARNTDCLVKAVDAPYDLKDKLKQRGYLWRPAELQNGRVWWMTTDDPETEIAWLLKEVYGRDVSVASHPITARERYSERL
jgi:DNA polymerase III subunit epsilon